MPRPAATRRVPSATCCCPRFRPSSRRVGWISEGALNYICERLSVPPADAYGVVTFYALLSTVPRPRRVLHVCDDIACRCKGAAQGVRGAGADRRPRVPSRPRRRPRRDRRERRHLAAEPLPGPLRPGAGRARHRRRQGAGGAALRRSGRGEGEANPGRRSGPEPDAAPAPPAGGRRVAATAPAGGRRRSDEPGRVPGARRIRGAAGRDPAGPRGRDPRGHRRQAARPRRAPRSPPDGSGTRWPASRCGRTTSSATPTSPSPARSRTASSWRATRSASSRP